MCVATIIFSILLSCSLSTVVNQIVSTGKIILSTNKQIEREREEEKGNKSAMRVSKPHTNLLKSTNAGVEVSVMTSFYAFKYFISWFDYKRNYLSIFAYIAKATGNGKKILFFFTGEFHQPTGPAVHNIVFVLCTVQRHCVC